MSTTAAARFCEKVLANILDLGIDGFSFVPQRGPDDPTKKVTIKLPLGVVAVVDGPDTRELVFNSGVYSMAVKVVVMSNMDQTTVEDHELRVAQTEALLKAQVFPQAWYDTDDPTNRLTLSGLDVAGPAIPVSNDQGRADTFTCTVGCSTTPFSQ